MTPLTTKAAEIRAGLVAELRAACVGHPNASIAWPHRVLHQAADLIVQQAAELVEARREHRNIQTALAEETARTIAAVRERDEARAALQVAKDGWRDAESTIASQSERIAVLEAAVREKSKRVEALEGRYEDWKPVSEPPHEVQIERGVLLNFYRDADEGTWWNGTWEERRDADIWCGLVTAGLNDRARAALPQEPPAPIGEAGHG